MCTWQYLRADKLPFNREILTACMEVWSTAQPNRPVDVAEIDRLLSRMQYLGYDLGHKEWSYKIKAYADTEGVEGMERAIAVSKATPSVNLQPNLLLGGGPTTLNLNPSLILQAMEAAGIRPTRDIFLTQVETLAKGGDIEAAMAFRADLERGPYKHIVGQHSCVLPIVRGLAQTGRFDEARALAMTSPVPSRETSARMEPLFETACRDGDSALVASLLEELEATVRFTMSADQGCDRARLALAAAHCRKRDVCVPLVFRSLCGSRCPRVPR